MVSIKLKNIYKQPNDYSCGATSLKTLLEYEGTKVDLDELMKIAKTSEKVNPIKNLAEAAEYFGYEAILRENATLDDLYDNLEAGKIPLVRYLIPENGDPHYSLVVGIDESKVSIADSEIGAVKDYARDEFSSSWYGIDSPGCMMTIRKRG